MIYYQFIQTLNFSQTVGKIFFLERIIHNEKIFFF